MIAVLQVLVSLLLAQPATGTVYLGVSCAAHSLYHTGTCFETRMNFAFVEALEHVANFCTLALGQSCTQRGYTAPNPDWLNASSAAPLSQIVLDVTTVDVTAFALPYDCSDADCVSEHAGVVVNPATGWPTVSPSATSTLSESEHDAHGCHLLSGYSFCVVRGECVRYWETPCTSNATVQQPAKPLTEPCTTTVAGCAWAGMLGLDIGNACDCGIAQKIAYRTALAIYKATHPHGGPRQSHEVTSPTSPPQRNSSQEDACTTTIAGCGWAGAIGVDIGDACNCDVAHEAAYKTALAIYRALHPHHQL